MFMLGVGQERVHVLLPSYFRSYIATHTSRLRFKQHLNINNVHLLFPDLLALEEKTVTVAAAPPRGHTAKSSARRAAAPGSCRRAKLRRRKRQPASAVRSLRLGRLQPPAKSRAGESSRVSTSLPTAVRGLSKHRQRAPSWPEEGSETVVRRLLGGFTSVAFRNHSEPRVGNAQRHSQKHS